MTRKGKVQTTESGTNVLVEHEDGSNRHYSHLDFPVNCTLMTNEEIDLEFSKINFTRDQKVSMMSKVHGFAISNSIMINGVYYSSKDLFKYEKI